MTVNVLGTEYELLHCVTSEMTDPDYIGECNRYTKTIKINMEYFGATDVETSAMYKTIRHEIIHAFFHEAGLDCYSEDETLVDTLAVLIPKMLKAFAEAV